MRRRKLDTIAKHWWRASYDDYSFSYSESAQLDRLARSERTLAPLLRAAVRTARGPFGLSYVGTWFVEDLIHGFEQAKLPDRTIDILAATGLRGDTLTEILSGVYPRMLQAIGAGERLTGLVSDSQRAWLVDESRPVGRPSHPNRATRPPGTHRTRRGFRP